MTLFKILDLIETSELVNHTTLTEERINGFQTMIPQKIIEIEDPQNPLFYDYKVRLESVLGSTVYRPCAMKILINHYIWAEENREISL